MGEHNENNVNAQAMVDYAISLRAYAAFRGSKIIFVTERNAFGINSMLSMTLGASGRRFCNYLVYADKDKRGFLTDDKNKAFGIGALQRSLERREIKLYAPFRNKEMRVACQGNVANGTTPTLIEEWRKTLTELDNHVQSWDPEENSGGKKRSSKKRIRYHAASGKDDRVMTLAIGTLVIGTFSRAAEEICIEQTNGAQTLCNCQRGVGHS